MTSISAHDWRIIQQAQRSAKQAQARVGHSFLSADHVTELVGIQSDALTALKRGEDPMWALEQLTIGANLSDTMMQMRISDSQAGRLLVAMAKAAMASAVERHNERGSWSLRASEITAIDAMIEVHRDQLQKITYRQYQVAYEKTKARMVQARKAGGGSGVRMVDVSAPEPAAKETAIAAAVLCGVES